MGLMKMIKNVKNMLTGLLNKNINRKEVSLVAGYVEEFEQLVETESKVGLEVGPLDRPFVDKSANNVFYVDYFDEEQLRRKIRGNKNRNPEAIVNLDYVLGGRNISEVVDRSFDYIFTSHVLEHLPNLFGWLNDVSKVLNPEGIVFCIVPDCRYCFDIERPNTGLGELIENYSLDRKRPAPRHVFDQHFYHKKVKAASLWSSYFEHKKQVERTFDVHQSYEMFTKAQQSYHDCHVNLFTPDSIKECIVESRKLGLHQFKIIKVSQTRRNKLDFFIDMRLD